MSQKPKQFQMSQWQKPVTIIGNKEILQSKKLALFCSRKCPGNLILKAYDLARNLRERSITVISGFHTPVEKECMRILLRGDQPMIICPARSIEGMRIPSAWKQAIGQGRFLLLSPFEKNHRRMTAALAEQRNQFIISVADEVLFIHAADGSQTAQLAHANILQGKTTCTLNFQENRNLLDAGFQNFA